jgi:hypothetical protein
MSNKVGNSNNIRSLRFWDTREGVTRGNNSCVLMEGFVEHKGHFTHENGSTLTGSQSKFASHYT